MISMKHNISYKFSIIITSRYKCQEYNIKEKKWTTLLSLFLVILFQFKIMYSNSMKLKISIVSINTIKFYRTDKLLKCIKKM